MICDGSFPTYLLQFWGRDAPPSTGCRSSGSSSSSAPTPRRWSACTTAACSRRASAPTSTSSTSTPSAIGAPEMLHDLPAGGKRLVQRATGYRATVVAGETVMRDGEPTGALPGRLVRGARN